MPGKTEATETTLTRSGDVDSGLSSVEGLAFVLVFVVGGEDETAIVVVAGAGDGAAADVACVVASCSVLASETVAKLPAPDAAAAARAMVRGVVLFSRGVVFCSRGVVLSRAEPGGVCDVDS